jgi:beta-glucosidase-like glycosyl hydrolase
MTMADLLSQLTLAEKAGLVLGSTMWHTAPVPRLGIPAVVMSDGPHGLRRLPDGQHAGISGSLPATCCPTASALGSSWDPDLVRRPNGILGEAETRVVLGDFPLRTRTTFPRLGIDHAVLAEVTASRPEE